VAEARAHPIDDRLIMDRLIRHTSKTLALLAIMLLPIQQSLAAPCCCQGGQNCVDQSCCGSPNSESKPCQCPAECCKNAAPNSADPTTTGPTLKKDSPVAAVPSVSAINCENAARNSLGGCVAIGPASGFERCVRLCRYRL